jgi:hypothetical protein
MTTKFFFFFVLWIFAQKNSLAQYKIESLIGAGRPSLDNPKLFSDSLKRKAEGLLIERIGKTIYYQWVDTSYRYPHYYNNVYYNNAPSEKNYHVYFKMRPAEGIIYEFELVFKPNSLELVTPLEDIIPKCSKHSGSCSLLDKTTIEGICQANLSKIKETRGEIHFSFSKKYGCFIWHYAVQKLIQYPMGEQEILILNAATGKVLEKNHNPSFYMGR